MCLVCESKASTPQQIGYAVSVKITDGANAGTYLGLYWGCGYVQNERYCAENTYKDYYGFHGFYDLDTAKDYLQVFNACHNDTTRFRRVIIKCLFEEVMATGIQEIEDLQLPAFRAKYRTILEEIKE